MDRILIADLPVRCHIGVPKMERQNEQELWIDLELFFDTADAGRTDDFALTVDYSAVARKVIHVAQAKPRKLIETLAEEIAAAVLSDFPARRLKLRIRKPAALAQFEAAYAGVEIEREPHG